MRNSLITTCVIGITALTSFAHADNVNRCLSISSVPGYQFKNNCSEDVRVYSRSVQSMGQVGGWQSMLLSAGQAKMVDSYSNPVIVCPVSFKGREYVLNPSSNDCVAK